MVGSDPRAMASPLCPFPFVWMQPTAGSHPAVVPALPQGCPIPDWVKSPNQKNQHQFTTILLNFTLVQHHHPTSNRQGSLLRASQRDAGWAREMRCR